MFTTGEAGTVTLTVKSLLGGTMAALAPREFAILVCLEAVKVRDASACAAVTRVGLARTIGIAAETLELGLTRLKNMGMLEENPPEVFKTSPLPQTGKAGMALLRGAVALAENRAEAAREKRAATTGVSPMTRLWHVYAEAWARCRPGDPLMSWRVKQKACVQTMLTDLGEDLTARMLRAWVEQWNAVSADRGFSGTPSVQLLAGCAQWVASAVNAGQPLVAAKTRNPQADEHPAAKEIGWMAEP